MQSEFVDILAHYNRARQWLFSLITDLTGSRYHQDKSKDLRLQEFHEQIERTEDFLGFTGNPEGQFNSIHIAGTSGKGSVVNMIAAILSAGGLKTGFHVSPYLQVCNEKLIVDGRMISPSEFVTLVKDFRETYKQWVKSGGKFSSLKYGEAWVALTYFWMAQMQIDWGVIETGLGGRYDPTNVLPAKMAVITNVDYDHVVTLGGVLKEIAKHKAGIIKPGGIAVTSERKPEVLSIIRKEGEEKQAKLYCLGEDFDFTVEKEDDRGSVISVQTSDRAYNEVRISMGGNFQPVNAALSIASVDILAEEYNLPITEKAVHDGLDGLVYPGRMEIVQEKPLVLLDGAHNRHKMQGLVDSLQALYPQKSILAIIGMISTKDFQGMVDALSPIVSQWIVTQPHVLGKPSIPPNEIVEYLENEMDQAEVNKFDQVQEALDFAFSQAGEDDIVMVTGSLYLVGEARERWFPTREILMGLEKGS